MPTLYKAVTDHVPINCQADLDGIAEYMADRRGEFIALFARWKLKPLEYDDWQPLIERITRHLVDFALHY